MKTILVLLLLVLLVPLTAQAASLSVTIACATPPDEDGVIVLWFGYSSSDTLDNSGFGYIGNAAFGGNVQAGVFPRFAEFHVVPDEMVLFWAEGFAAGEHVYSEAWYSPGDIVPLCEDSGGTPEAPVLDDQGVANNADNPRGNTCYNPGQVCITEKDWIAGWHRMHA